MFETLIQIPAPESLYDAHQSVWGAVRGFEPRAGSRDFLYRVRGRVGHPVAIAKVRASSPVPGGETTTLVVPALGRRYKFSFLAHPVRRMNGRQEKPILGDGEIAAWAMELFARHGFDLTRVAVNETFHVPFGKAGHKVGLYAAQLSGTVSVVDEQCALRAFEGGMGRLKAMGFGMLELWEEK